MPWVIVVKLQATNEIPWTTTQAVGPYPDESDIPLIMRQLIANTSDGDIVSMYPLRLEQVINYDRINSTVAFLEPLKG
jgi:hypothetical protein